MGPLLDALYEDTKEKVLKFANLKDPDTFVTVSMDGWKAPSGQHIRNYMLNSDRATFFFDATDAGTTRPSGVNIGNEALAVINAIGAANVAAVANDNAAAETTSWDTIRDEYAGILCTGCSCHGGNLLFKDLFEHAFAKSLLEKCVKVAKFYKHHQYTSEELRTRTIAAKEQNYIIILHGETRFAGFYYCIKRLLFLRTILREIFASQGFEDRNISGREEIGAIINSNIFWRDAQRLRVFLKPLKCFIKLVDHDCHCTHHVYPGEYQGVVVVVFAHWLC